MRVLHLIASVAPESGGPIEYARAVAVEHAKGGHESLFVTLDAPDSAWINSFDFPVKAVGPGRGPFSAAFDAAVRRVAPDCDVAVIHGLWNPATVSGHAALKAADLPWVIFSHGMLDPYFRKIKPVKHWIKQCYWLLWQGRVLSGARTVLFTCDEERRRARGAFLGYDQRIENVVAFCASDQTLPEAEMAEGRADFLSRLPTLKGRDWLLFLSRIHPKKACDQLIEAFAKVAEIDPELDLVIAGPNQVGWQAKLEAQAAQLGIARRVHWPGMIKGAAKAAAFSGSRAFVLPSHQENFGLVVAEALSVGTPVLISKEVNIWREIEAAGAGITGPDTTEGTETMLVRFLGLTPEAKAAMCAAAKPCYDRHFSVPQAAADLEAVLLKAIGPKTLKNTPW